jgi:hypothetical protein
MFHVKHVKNSLEKPIIDYKSDNVIIRSPAMLLSEFKVFHVKHPITDLSFSGATKHAKDSFFKESR